MKTLNNESEILNRFRSMSSLSIKYIGNFFSCLRVELLTRSILFRKSWIDSSAKDILPPDFHNDKHHIMMEVMRIDDCIGMSEGKHIPNAFENENISLKKVFGEKYKKEHKDTTVFFIPDTRDHTKYNYEGYLKNFESVILKHSDKVTKYKDNYPKCKEVIFLISDESNEYCETSNLEDKAKVQEGVEGIKVKWHIPCFDNKFIEIIKKCKCDYIIWFQHYKNSKRKIKLLVPRIVIIDVKKYNVKGIDYNTKLIAKVKENHDI